MRLSRRALLAGGVSVIGSAVVAQTPLGVIRPQARAVQERVGDGGPPRPDDRIVARPDIASTIARSGVTGDTGALVYDIDTMEVIEAHLPETALMPASVTKVATALYVLDTFRAEHRFVTRLIATGPVVDGVIDGDLVLVGANDPVLNSDDLAVMVGTLTDQGITGITGDLRVWAGGLPEIAAVDPGQLAHLGYSPGVSGLNLNFNRVHFGWERSGQTYTVTMDARTEARRPIVRVSSMEVVDRSRPIYDYARVAGRDSWSVARGALGQDGSRWLPVRQPAMYAGDVLRSIAVEAGLILPAPQVIDAVPEGSVQAVHHSPTVEDIVRGMLRFSTNLTAEVLGRAATQARGGDASTLAASAAEMGAWLAETTGQYTQFADHSGLSDASRVSAASMVRILADADVGPLRGVLKSIALTSTGGDRLPDPPGVVVAKTGTLNFVSALAGFMDTTGERRLAFAIFSTDSVSRIAGIASGEEQPTGAATFNTRAKRLQQTLLQRWGLLYGALPVEVERIDVADE